MKPKVYFSVAFATSLITMGISGSISAHVALRPSTISVEENTSVLGTPIADLNLDNPPLPSKYAHPLRVGSLTRHRLTQGPIEDKANHLYYLAQESQNKGVAYLMYGLPQQAIVNLTKSCLLWPDYAATYRWLAEAYEADGQTSAAIANYRLLFYGWPGKYVPTCDDQPKEVPADKPSDYYAPKPEETDPTLLLRFSLLLQQTHQYAEAQAVYDRGIEALLQKFGSNDKQLPAVPSEALMTPSSLEAETRTALAIDQLSYQNKLEAQDNLKQALNLQPDSSLAAHYQSQLSK